MDDFKPEIIVRSDDWFLFVLSAIKYIEKIKTQTYIFLRKRVATVNELMAESMQSEKKSLARRNSLMTDLTEISILQPGTDGAMLPTFKKIKFESLNDYMLQQFD